MSYSKTATSRAVLKSWLSGALGHWDGMEMHVLNGNLCTFPTHLSVKPRIYLKSIFNFMLWSNLCRQYQHCHTGTPCTAREGIMAHCLVFFSGTSSSCRCQMYLYPNINLRRSILPLMRFITSMFALCWFLCPSKYTSVIK